MQRSKLNKLAPNTARDLYASGRISLFELELCLFYHGEISWKTYDAKAVAALREKMDISQATLADILCVSLPTVQRWESKDSPVPPLAQVALNVLDRLEGRIFRFLKSDYAILEHLAAFHPTESASPTIEVFSSLTPDQPPTEFDAAAIIKLRKKYTLSKKALADLTGVTVDAVRKWETDTSRPSRPITKLLRILWRDGPEGMP